MSWLTIAILLGATIIVVLLFLENKEAKRKNIKLYTMSDSITNFSCGLLERVFDVFFSVLALIAFDYIYNNIAPFPITLSIFSWIVGLFVTDFIAYWFHRFSHEINFLWAAHIVHHQSEELNITTVFRVSFLAVIYRAVFFSFMALAGFDAFTILTTSLFLGLYQLFTHSRVIGKLGVVESFMTTPSHHRVHHGRNEKYMDQNYGHIFIIWDRLFGTFTEEEEEPEYGITSGFESANPFVAVFSYWKNLFTRSNRTKSVTNKLLVFVNGPAWTPVDVEHLPNEFKVDHNGNRVHHQIPVSAEKSTYLLVSVLVTAIAFVALIILKSKLGQGVTLEDLWNNSQVMVLVTIIIVSVYAHASVIENKNHFRLVELLRLILIGVLTYVGFSSSSFSFWLFPTVVAYCIIMVIWLFRLYTLGK